MTIVNVIGLCAVLLVAGEAAARATAQAPLEAIAAEDGIVEAARRCEVYLEGSASGAGEAPLRYRWLAGEEELSAWTDVRADGTAPLDLCGLPAGPHTLTLEVTDGTRRASDTTVAVIVESPALVARRAAR